MITQRTFCIYIEIKCDIGQKLSMLSNQSVGGCSKHVDKEEDSKGNATRTRDRATARLDGYKCSGAFGDKEHMETLNGGNRASPFAFHLNNRCCQIHLGQSPNAQVAFIIFVLYGCG